MTRYGDIARLINGLRTPHDFMQLHRTFYFPLRREGRDAPAEPVSSCARSLCAIAHVTAGAACTRSSLRPLFSRAGHRDANLGRTASRDRGRISIHVVPAKRSASSDVQLHIGGPITTNAYCCTELEPHLRPHRTFVVMGPGVRRDDGWSLCLHVTSLKTRYTRHRSQNNPPYDTTTPCS